VIDCLRHGIKDRGVSLRLAYNKPPSSLNETLIQNYKSNIFTVSRQVYYSNQNKNSLDMVIFLNGLPIVVMELKNPLTNQTVEQAKQQFKTDRDQKNYYSNQRREWSFILPLIQRKYG